MASSPRLTKRNPVKLEASGNQARGTIKETLTPIVEKMTWGENENILDHGFNSGKKVFDILAPLAEKTSSTVYVLDNCPHTIDHAETNFPHAKIQYILGELSLPPGTLGDLKFNKVFSFYGFYFTHDYRSALNSMYEHLVPGGESFFMIPTKANIFDLNRLLCGHPEWGEHAEEHFTVPDYIHDGKDNSGNLKNVFIETGFELKEFDVNEMSYEYKNSREIADFYLSLNPFLLLLPKDKHDQLEEFYYDFFAKTKTELYNPACDSPDGKYLFPYTCAHVYAKKPE